MSNMIPVSIKLWSKAPGAVGKLGKLIRSPLGRPPPGAVTVIQNIFQNVGYREIIVPYRILNVTVLNIRHMRI